MTSQMTAKEKTRAVLIRGGRIIDPDQGIDETGSLLITGSKISWRGKGKATPPKSNYDLLDAKGMVVCPGFIDFHCHLRQPGFEDKETIASGSLAAVRGGFTTICAMPNTNPPTDNQETLENIKETAKQEALIRVLPIGSVTLNRDGKKLARLAELAKAGAIGFSDDGSPVTDSEVMRQALESSRNLNLPIIDHCEESSLAKGGQMNEGIVSRKLGLRGMPAAAEWLMVIRNVALAQLTGGWIHIAHVSTAQAVDSIRNGKERGVKVTAEVTPHHLTLTEEAVAGYDTNAKVNPPLRTERDIQSLIKGLNDGVIDIIATDHAPHTEAEKQAGFDSAPSGISVLETALGSLLTLVTNGKISLSNLIANLTTEPAKIIGQDRLGTLTEGSPAEITIFDPNRKWKVDTTAFASKGKNSPLAGSTLKGKVIATIFGGEFVYKDGLMEIKSNVAKNKRG